MGSLRSRMRRILKFLHLPSTDRRVLVKSAFLLIIVRLGLSILPFKTLLDFIDSMKPKAAGGSSVDMMSPDRLVWAVVVASKYIPFTKCLTQALVAQILFAQYGYAAQLRIGVKKDGRKRLKAHAWVESQGQIVIGDFKDLSHFSPLPTLEREKP